ncbi:hypothetical protein [Microbulbifer sp. PSTR4-B]|uniref:hypothetical protein n=1 Tax=unclassified Microbulbifer TaxID=2619833 RepID=UPI00403B0385
MVDKPSEACKAAGLDSLNELAEMSGKTVATLSNWWNKERRLFELVLKGAVFERQAQSMAAIFPKGKGANSEKSN